MAILKWLKLSWKIGQIRGLEIRLHISILLGIVLTYYLFRPTDVQTGLLVFLLLLGFLFSIFLHELAHAVAARLVKLEVKSIIVWLLGGLTILSHEPEKPLQRLFIYFAGPFITLLLGILFFGIYYYVPYEFLLSGSDVYARLFSALAGINIILFIFNILPVYPLDGGNILQALMELFFGKSRANLITMVISIPILIGLIVFGFYTRDYILLVFCIFIAVAIGTLNWRTLHWMNLGLNYLLRRGGYYYLQGDYDRALQYATREIERHPERLNNYVLRAACYMYMSQNDRALLDVQRMLAIAPENEMALLLYGDHYLLKKEYDAAWEWYEKARQLYPNSALPHYCCGSTMHAKKEFQSAIEALDKAISLRLSFALCYVERSMAHFRLGNLEAAHKDQDAALHLSEKDALTRAEFNLQVYEGYLDWAEDYYGRVLLRLPRSSYAYQGRADIYRVNHEHEKAIADYTKALEINPRELRLYLGRGKSYCASGQMDRAAADFRHILDTTDKLYLRRQAEELLASLG